MPIQTEGRFLQTRKGVLCAARVWLTIEPAADQPAIELQCAGPGPAAAQGELDDVSAAGFPAWPEAARVGARYALHVAQAQTAHVTITRILGRAALDTNPTVVAAAAAAAVWNGLQFEPGPAVRDWLARCVFESWGLPDAQKTGSFFAAVEP